MAEHEPSSRGERNRGNLPHTAAKPVLELEAERITANHDDAGRVSDARAPMASGTTSVAVSESAVMYGGDLDADSAIAAAP